MFDTYSKAPSDGGLSGLLVRIVPVWRDRSDSEHEQAVIRVLVGLVGAAYLILALSLNKKIPELFQSTLFFLMVFFVAALMIIAWLVINPRKNIPRRLLGCIIDIGTTTLLLLLNGNQTVPFFIVCLWVTFGNGFRYGRSYLLFSMILSLAGFCLVLFYSGSWSASRDETIGLLTGMVVLPLYVASLLQRLEKSLEMSEVASRAKSNFLAIMSHEIRTPLTGIIGVLDLLEKTRLNKQQRHFVHLLGTSSDWLLRIISDGLDFTKIEADELIVDSSPTNLREVLRSVSDVFSEVASEKKIRFVSKVDPDIPEVIECDQFRIIQILNNLLHNAFKFTNQGVVGLSVSCKNRTNGTVEINFSVHDTGIGIAEEHLDKIFKPFRQADTSASRTHGGTGLGLTIASRIVTLMGGNIQVDSKQGNGTTFSFTLNFNISAHSVLSSASPVKTRVLWQRQPVVLLVEDNEINREVAVNLLEYLGCKVFTAENGLSALKTVEKNDFDILLMDCQMPQMDGYEATRRIRELSDNHAKIPIIALTAHITNQDREKCFEAGMVDYMGKPYRVETLELLLRKWMPSLIAGDEVSTIDTVPSNEEENSQDKDASREIVHDLHNALTGIMGGAELALIYQNEPNQLEKQLKSILKAAKQAIKVASGL